MLTQPRIFRGSRSQLVILACLCVGMIYVCRTGPGSSIFDTPGTDPSTASDNENGVQWISRQQKNRKTLVHRVCDKIKKAGLVQSAGLASQHLIVDDDLRIIYCYVPKAASTNWKRVLLSLRNPRLSPLSIRPDAGHKHGWTVISSLKDKRLKDRDYFKFLVVRNPFERLLSAYRNKFEFPYNGYFRGRYGKNMKGFHHDKQPITNLSSNDGIPTFEDFISYISWEKSEKNEHWQTVNDMCHPCDIMFDFIGKYETLQEDSDFILKYITSSRRIHRNWSFPLRTETYTSTKPAGELMESYYESIPTELRRKLSESFGSDISLFGYAELFKHGSTETRAVSNESNSNP